MPANILNLPQYRVLRVEESEHDCHVTAETVEVTSACPHCKSDRLTSWGTREQVFKDLPLHGKRVAIYIDTKRLRCQSCGKTFSQALPVLAENRMMTERLVRWIGQLSLKRAFTNWQPCILNYFEYPVTSACTESLHSLIRVMNRLERGYSFEALRARILFTEGIHGRKQARPGFERKRSPEPIEMGLVLPDEAMGYALRVSEKVRQAKSPKSRHQHKSLPPPGNYGADISTLIRMIEAGEL